MERCLGAEGELDRSRSSLIELRRKLDDSQAALHELGRENQSIQVKYILILGHQGKWFIINTKYVALYRTFYNLFFSGRFSKAVR